MAMKARKRSELHISEVWLGVRLVYNCLFNPVAFDFEDRDEDEGERPRYRMFGRLYGCLSSGQTKWLDPDLSLTRFLRHFCRRKPRYTQRSRP